MSTNYFIKLHDVQTTLSLKDFEAIYGSLADHLWKHYRNTGHNLLTFIRLLDSANADLMTSYINLKLSSND